MSEAAPVLEAEDLVVRYHGGGDPAVRGASLRLAAGEGLLIDGPPGAGKTSLLRGLLGLVPSGGAVRLPARGRVGFGPQGSGFAAELRVAEAVGVVARLRGAGRDEASGAVERAGLGYVGDWRTARLDAEGHRRLALALAIAGDPDLVVLDDPWTLAETLAEIRSARARGAAVLVASSRPAGLAPALGGRRTLIEGRLR